MPTRDIFSVHFLQSTLHCKTKAMPIRQHQQPRAKVCRTLRLHVSCATALKLLDIFLISFGFQCTDLALASGSISQCSGQLVEHTTNNQRQGSTCLRSKFQIQVARFRIRSASSQLVSITNNDLRSGQRYQIQTLQHAFQQIRAGIGRHRARGDDHRDGGPGGPKVLHRRSGWPEGPTGHL